jgi:hypothetical protein
MEGAKAAAVGGTPEKPRPDMNLRGEGKMPSRQPAGPFGFAQGRLPALQFFSPQSVKACPSNIVDPNIVYETNRILSSEENRSGWNTANQSVPHELPEAAAD